MTHNPPQVAWAIDGHPVPLVWDSVSMSVPGGLANMGQVVVPQEFFPSSADVFSLVTATRSDGAPFYVGELAGPPHLHHGQVVLEVGNLQNRIARQRGRRLYQSKDLSQWVTMDAEPHLYGVTAGTVSDVRDGIAQFTQTATPGQSGIVFWAKGERIIRVAFTISGGTWNLASAVGPAGTLTTEGSGVGGSNQDITIDATGSGSQDLVRLLISSTVDTRVRITNLRVNGRAATDAMSNVQLAEDMASTFGWTNVSPLTAANLLPMNWEDDWQAGLTEAAARFDGMWLIVPNSDHEADFYLGPWGRNMWTVRGGDYADLVPQVRYSRAVVAYDTPGKVRLESIADADPNPYGALDERTVTWPPGGPFVLNDAQTDSTNADTAAGLLAEYWSQPRVSGQVSIARLWGADDEAHPWDIEAGDLLNIPDLELMGSATLGPQRVVEVSKLRNGTSTVSVSEATSLDGLLGRLDDPMFTGGLDFDIDAIEANPKPEKKPKKKPRRGHQHRRGGPGKDKRWSDQPNAKGGRR